MYDGTSLTGGLLSRRLRLAISDKDVQKAFFDIFSEQQGSRVDVWKKMVLDFETDPSKQNPYEVPCTGFTENDVRLQFAREEAEGAARGEAALHEVTPSGFIGEAKLRARALIAEKAAGTSAQLADVADIRKKLRRNLARLRALQAVYLPTVIPLLVQRVVPEGEEAEYVPIFFPSSLPEAERVRCDKRVVEVEVRLREAKCRSALDEIRNLLFIKSRNESEIKLQMKKFQLCWAALKSLANGDESQLKWPALKQEHVRCMEDPDTPNTKEVRRARASEVGREDYRDRDDPSQTWEGERERVLPREGYRTMSWIWMEATEGDSETNQGMYEVLRSEFAKSWARVRRWTEEVDLLKEEMRRTIVTLRHRARRWEREGERTQSQTPGGLSAYAYSQADLLHGLADKYEAAWTEKRMVSNGIQDNEEEDLLEQEVRKAQAAQEEQG
ncbi:hypothetical protein EYR38_002023 [Pleurotus pulmonarius]|nr:hypothetical protein EYR38_002023 [Pleurotus pulmonarius]